MLYITITLCFPDGKTKLFRDYFSSREEFRHYARDLFRKSKANNIFWNIH